MQEEVSAAYNAMFPKGHGDKSYKEVLRQIEPQLSQSVSLDTLKRSIKSKI